MKNDKLLVKEKINGYSFNSYKLSVNFGDTKKIINKIVNICETLHEEITIFHFDYELADGTECWVEVDHKTQEICVFKYSYLR